MDIIVSGGERTLMDVAALVEREGEALARHPFLRRLEGAGSLEQMRSIARRFAFFVLSFQDVLRLARQRSTDTAILPIARTHELEDRGHDQWFLDDLARLGVPLDARALFSAEHEAVRDASHELIAEVLKARDDRARLAVVLSLEAGGKQFFARVIGFLERLGHADGLSYFARHHQSVEQDHDVFVGEAHTRFSAIEVPAAVWPEVEAVVASAFTAMRHIASDLEAMLPGDGSGSAARDEP